MARIIYCTAVRRTGDTFSSRPNIRVGRQAPGLPATLLAWIANAGNPSFPEVNLIVVREAVGCTPRYREKVTFVSLFAEVEDRFGLIRGSARNLTLSSLLEPIQQDEQWHRQDRIGKRRS